MSAARRSLAASVAGVGAAAASALCCVGPLAAVFLGLSGAGFAAVFEPLRPYFAVAAFLGLGTGYFLLRREERNACQPGTACATPRTRRKLKRWLIVATVLAAALVTIPWWLKLIIA